MEKEEYFFNKFAIWYLWSSLMSFESLIKAKKCWSRISFLRIKAHETTGPQSAPLPTSSIPMALS